MRHRTSRERDEAANREGWWRFVLDSFVAPVSSGRVPARSDFDELPERSRTNARVIVDEALDLWDEGNQGGASQLATEQFRELVAGISPQREPPLAADIDVGVVDQIRRRVGA